MALIRSGDKLLLSHRRLFEGDQPRYFAGTVNEFDDGLVQITGYTFVREAQRGGCLRKEDSRTKLASLSSGTMIVYLLPKETVIEELHFEHGENQRVILTDGHSCHMDMSERVG